MNTLEFALLFKRQQSGPLDVDSVFDTLTDMNNYLTNELRYPGQVVVCREVPKTLFVLSDDRTTWDKVSGVEWNESEW
jgi:hypothetical protein